MYEFLANRTLLLDRSDVLGVVEGGIIEGDNLRKAEEERKCIDVKRKRPIGNNSTKKKKSKTDEESVAAVSIARPGANLEELYLSSKA